MANKLIIDIDGNAKALENKLSGLAGMAQKAFSGVGAIGTAALKGIATGAGAAVTAVSAVATAAVKGYADYEQLTGGIETLFKSSSDIIKEYAENAYKTAGLSANQYMDNMMNFSASLLQGLGGDTKEAARIGNVAIEDMADNANKMGTSMGSIEDAYKGFAKQNYTMLDNLKLGYGGTKEEMLRLVNDAGIAEQKFTDINQVSFDQIIMAIHKVQENMGITGTTAAEAEKTITGSANMARAAWRNLMVGLADENANLDQLMKNFSDSVVTLMGNLVPRIKQALKGIAKVALKIGDSIFGKDFSASVMKGWNSTFKPIINSVSGYMSTLKTAFASGGLSGVINQIKSDIIGIIPPEIYTILQVFGSAFTTAWGILRSGASALSFIGTAFTGLVTTLAPEITKVKEYIGGIGAVFQQSGLKGVVEKIKTDIVGLIPDSVITAVDSFKKTIAALIPQDVKDALSSVRTSFQNMATAFAEGGLGAALTQAKTDFAEMIPDGMQKNLATVKDDFNLLGQYIANHKQDFIDIGTTIVDIAGGMVTFVKNNTLFVSAFAITYILLTKILPAITAVSIAIGIANWKFLLISATVATIITLIAGLVDAFEGASVSIKNFGTGAGTAADDPLGLGDFAPKAPEKTVLTPIKVEPGEVDTSAIPETLNNAISTTDLTATTKALQDLIKLSFDSMTMESDMQGVKDGVTTSLDGVNEDATKLVKELTKGVEEELKKFNDGTMTQPVDDMNDKIVKSFERTYDDIYGHSIVPDLVNNVNTMLSGWWGTMQPSVEAVTNGMVTAFQNMATTITDIFSTLTSLTIGLGGESKTTEGKPTEAGAKAGAETGTGETSSFVDMFQPIPQTIIDSYTALSTALLAVNTEVAKLNGFFGGAVAAEGAAAEGAAAEGGGGSLLAGMTAVAEYISGTMTTTLTEFGEFLSGTFAGNITFVSEMLYMPGGEGNTLYNALGTIQGEVEDIKVAFENLISVMKVSFKEAVDKVKEQSGVLLGVLKEIENAGWAIYNAFMAALSAIEAVMSAGSGKIKTAEVRSSEPINNNPLIAAAWGGWTSSKGLTLVGERGPELIGTSRMMNVWRNDEIQKRLSAARDKVASLSSSMINVAGNRSIDQSTTNNNSTSMNFGNVYGESYLNQMIETAIERYTRKAVWLGSKG